MTENILVLEPGDERAQKIAKAMASQTANDILHLLGEGQANLTDIADHLNLPLNTVKYHLENLLEAGLVSVAETKYSVKGREVKMYSLTNQLLIVAPRQSPVRSLILKYASLFGIVLLATFAIAAFAPLFGMVGFSGTAENALQAAPPALPTLSPTASGSGDAAAKAAVMASPTAHQEAEVMSVPLQGTGGTKGTEPTGTAAAARDDGTAVKEPVTAPDTTPVPARAALDSEAATGESYAAAAVPGPQAPAPASSLAAAFFCGGVLVIFILLCYEAWLWKKK